MSKRKIQYVTTARAYKDFRKITELKECPIDKSKLETIYYKNKKVLWCNQCKSIKYIYN